MRNLAVYTESTFEKYSRRLGLFLFAPLLFVLAIPMAVQIAQKPDLGFFVHNLEVVSLDPGGPAAAAGLEVGDRLVSLDDTILNRNYDFYATVAATLRPVARHFVVKRVDQNIPVTIIPRRPGQAKLIRSYSEWAAGLGFLAIGWWVLLKRRDPVARNFFGLCIIFAFFLMDIPDLTETYYMAFKEYLRSLLQFLLPAYFLRFFFKFPSSTGFRRGPSRGVPGRLRWLFVPAWVLFLLSMALEMAGRNWEARYEPILGPLTLIYAFGYFIAGLVIFGRRVFRRDRPIQQTKLKVILWGLALGLIPFLAALILGTVRPASTMPHWQVLSLSLLLVPASFALAILRYGALDTAFVVRVSLLYGTLTLLVLVNYFLIVVALGKFLAAVFHMDPNLLLLVVVAASSLILLPARGVIQGWIDRTFYPGRRANQRTMAKLADDLTGLIDAQDVILALHKGLDRLFRPSGFHLFLARPTEQDGTEFRSTAISDPGIPKPDRPGAPDQPPGPVMLSGNSGLTLLLGRIRHPLFSEEIEDLLFTTDTDQESLTLLTTLGAILLVPMVSGNRLVGFMAFGYKGGTSIYTQEDLANLHALAVQAASVIESLRLYRKSLDQKTLEAELEVARKIQARLLPTEPLEEARYIVAGKHQPCRMVGGDYFDYFPMQDGTLAVAIADVSGKGVPAALMMSSVRAAFRQETLNQPGPGEVLTRLNPLVKDQITLGNFICFFYATWNPTDGILHYCNAGLDPPVVYRAASGFRQPLKKGGPVLGVSRKFTYREGTLVLAPGDRVFMYTDGLTEESNAHGDFFDPERLLELVGENPQQTPSELLELIFAQVRAFGGDEASDDKTAIVLKIKDL